MVATMMSLSATRVKHSPLRMAAKHGHFRVVELLLQRRANPDAIAPRLGLSALILASQHGRASVARLLLAAGADVEYTPSNPSMLRRHQALFCVALHGFVAAAAIVRSPSLALHSTPPLPPPVLLALLDRRCC